MSKKIRLRKTAMFQDSEGDCLCIACGAEAVRKIEVESLMDVCEVIE